jgi:hypothetical protein
MFVIYSKCDWKTMGLLDKVKDSKLKYSKFNKYSKLNKAMVANSIKMNKSIHIELHQKVIS